MIAAAKVKGLSVACEVCPHLLFLSSDDIPILGEGRAEVRPVLVSKEDQQALWDHIDIIDCIATDHAPHTVLENNSAKVSMLPLMLTVVNPLSTGLKSNS